MDFAKILEDAVTKAHRERGHVNILIAGRSGVGKSTLINAIFQGEFATTGQGRPVTKETREISKPGLPLTIFDTRGLEMQAFDETLKGLESTVRLRCGEIDPKRHIHAAWICIQEDGRRVEDAEILTHEMLSRYMPVLGVITKARSDGGFRDEAQRLLPHARNIVRVRAIPEEFDDGHALPPFGLDKLVEVTFDMVPEGQRRAFAAAQKVSVKQKTASSQKVIAGAAASAAAVAAVPLPFSDAMALVPVQTGMLAGISMSFGLELSAGFLGTLVSAAIGGMGAAVAGRAIAGGLLKLIPGAGSAAGAAIAAGTASTLTVALGEAYLYTLVTLFTEGSGEIPSHGDIAAKFLQVLKNRRK